MNNEQRNRISGVLGGGSYRPTVIGNTKKDTGSTPRGDITDRKLGCPPRQKGHIPSLSFGFYRARSA